jgi:hypothetical protein
VKRSLSAPAKYPTAALVKIVIPVMKKNIAGMNECLMLLIASGNRKMIPAIIDTSN